MFKWLSDKSLLKLYDVGIRWSPSLCYKVLRSLVVRYGVDDFMVRYPDLYAEWADWHFPYFDERFRTGK